MKLAAFSMIFGLALAACSGSGGLGPDPEIYREPIGLTAESLARLNVRSVSVSVPTSLIVSTNPNEQFPQTDIVWYEDPVGDRRVQVQTIVETGMKQAVAGLRGSAQVDVLVTVRKFHAVTPKALASSLPAWHDIKLDIQIRSADSTAVAASVGLNADSIALTQGTARAALAAGETQKSRIIARISQAVRLWLQSGA